MQVAITGSSGLIGTELTRALELSGHAVLRLVRSGPGRPDTIRWDPDSGAIDAAGLEGVDAVVHLAGESIGGARWSEERKQRILDSRVRGTGLLATTLASLSSPPRVLISGSAVGFYGDRGTEILTEESSSGGGFLADVVRRWEAATVPAEEAGIRVAHIRTGIVLSRLGGALQRMLLPFKLGLGGRLGSGRQYWSWISLDDEVAAIQYLIERDDVSGPVNLTAPNPVTQKEFATTLAGALHRPALLPTPVFAVKAMFGGQLVEETLLGGQRVLPARLESAGFRFLHPTLEGALPAILAPSVG